MGRDRITIVEVGPRDGLQNEPNLVPTQMKLNLVERLAKAGLTRIEATAFVSPQWVPQLADHKEVMSGLIRHPGVVYSALVPNERGAGAALQAGAAALAVFTAASETFSQKNTNCSIAEGLERFRPVMALAAKAGVPVRGYVSCALDCPYEGQISPEAVAKVSARLFELGCSEIAVSDTIGSGTPTRTAQAFEAVLRYVPAQALAGHFHDTQRRALDNIAAILPMGVTVFDSAVGGLGGCPYAPGASGNLATEALVGWLEAEGWETGVDLAEVNDTATWLRQALNRDLR